LKTDPAAKDALPVKTDPAAKDALPVKTDPAAKDGTTAKTDTKVLLPANAKPDSPSAWVLQMVAKHFGFFPQSIGLLANHRFPQGFPAFLKSASGPPDALFYGEGIGIVSM